MPAPKRAQELRLHLRLHQLFVFRRPSVRPVGAAHFTPIPGCEVAPIAFTVSPLGAKINEKIFEKRLVPNEPLSPAFFAYDDEG